MQPWTLSHPCTEEQGILVYKKKKKKTAPLSSVIYCVWPLPKAHSRLWHSWKLHFSCLFNSGWLLSRRTKGCLTWNKFLPENRIFPRGFGLQAGLHLKPCSLSQALVLSSYGEASGNLGIKSDPVPSKDVNSASLLASKHLSFLNCKMGETN